MLKLLTKTICLSFYGQHAGLFLVVFYLLFGAVEGSQLISYHYALLIAICSSPIAWLIMFLLWSVYGVKCYLFITQKLTLPTFTFTAELLKMGMRSQLNVWLKVYACLLIPILSYSVLILYISAKHHYFFCFFATLIGVIILLTALTFLTFKNTNYNYNPTTNWINIASFKMNKPFWSWPLFYLLHQQPLMLFACKLVSFLALKSIVWVFSDIGDDIRVFLTAMLAVVLSHAILIFTWTKFDAAYQAFVKSLNVGTLTRGRYWLIVFTILLFPEITILAWLVHFDVIKLAIIFVFCLSSLFTLFSMVYLFKADMERYMKYVFIFFLVTMLAVLAGYYLLFSLVLLVSSMLVFITCYRKIDIKDIA